MGKFDRVGKEANRSKFEKRGSVGTKLVLIIVVTLSVVLGAKTVYEAYTSYSRGFESKKESMSYEASSFAGQVTNIFTGIYQASVAFDHNIENTIESVPMQNRSRDLIIDTATDLLESNDYISGIGVYFEPNEFDGRDADYEDHPLYYNGHFAIYLHKENSNVSIDRAFDYDDRNSLDWYTRPSQEQKMIVLSPYVDPDYGMMTTIAAPIFSGSRVVGVINIDINLGVIQEYFNNVYEQGNADN
ncbi:MAG: hypothetical protein GX219_07540, partial [Tissierellia bacterium]|nr:hypothetical protein [Tissierellia bacterium]